MPHNRVPDPIRLDHRARHGDPGAPFADELADLATDGGTEDTTGAWSGPPDPDAHPDGFTQVHQLHEGDPAADFTATGPVAVTGPGPDGPAATDIAPVQSAAFELFEAGQPPGGGPPR